MPPLSSYRRVGGTVVEPDQRRRLVALEGSEPQELEGLQLLGRGDLGHHGRLEATRAVAEGDQHAPARGTAHQVADQLERCAVAPLEVVERDQDRLAGREAADQLSHGAMDADAVVGRRRVGRARGERTHGRKRGRELVDLLGGERAERGRRCRLEVAVERVDEESERQLSLELGSPAVEDQAVLVRGAVGRAP